MSIEVGAGVGVGMREGEGDLKITNQCLLAFLLQRIVLYDFSDLNHVSIIFRFIRFALKYTKILEILVKFCQF